jgi:hypothetical protein
MMLSVQSIITDQQSVVKDATDLPKRNGYRPAYRQTRLC